MADLLGPDGPAKEKHNFKIHKDFTIPGELLRDGRRAERYSEATLN